MEVGGSVMLWEALEVASDLGSVPSHVDGGGSQEQCASAAKALPVTVYQGTGGERWVTPVKEVVVKQLEEEAGSVSSEECEGKWVSPGMQPPEEE